jgi:hypothetical protein
MAIKIVFLEENKKMQAVHCTKYLPAAGRPSTMYQVASEASLR